jgi:hypothetical protein
LAVASVPWTIVRPKKWKVCSAPSPEQFQEFLRATFASYRTVFAIASSIE